MSRHRRRVAIAGYVVLTALAGVGFAAPAPAQPTATASAAAPATDGYRQTKTLTRTFADAQGADVAQSSYDVTVAVDQTTDLRGRQRVRVSWSGAQPSGGRASNPYGGRGMQQEYPVVVLQCRGVENPERGQERLRPETCWTSSFSQRSQVQKSLSVESTWTRDVANDAALRERVSGPDPFPSAEECPTADTAGYATHLTEFVAASGTRFPACDADRMPPEAAVDGAFPPAEVAAFTDADGNGSVQFEVRTNVENESLGCSYEVDCSIVVVPIVGLSCAQPASPPSRLDRECRKTGQFAPGSSNFTNLGVDQAVGPALWWSGSNWRHRFAVPITFGLPPSVCDVLDSRPAVGFYGSELLAQAALQWAPAYCLSEDRFKFQLNQMSDIAGFNLMQSGAQPAAVVSSRHEPAPAGSPEGTGDPIGYAPIAVTGFGIGYAVDRPENAGEKTDLRLNARLIAKLLTQSYLGSDLGRGHPGIGGNPLGIMADPEFVALNPGLSENPQEAGAALLNLSDSSDVVRQLTAYLAADADARAFVAGKPDPWGMVVNPSYRDVELPRDEWPLLDTFVPQTQDQCRTENPAVYFNQLAAPVTRLRPIAEAVLDGWPNVQTRCELDPATGRYRIGRVEQQSFGSRFVLGVVSLGDAARFGLRTALLETRADRYVGATEAGLRAAVGLLEPTARRQPFTLDQADVAADGRAYPGTMVVYSASRLRNLPQEQADDVAQFIRIATTEGQRAGNGNGQLPRGFLPILRTGPTAVLKTAADDVADAVEAQAGPREPGGPDGPEETDDPDDPGTDEPVDTDTDGPGTTGPGGTGPGGTDLGGVPVGEDPPAGTPIGTDPADGTDVPVTATPALAASPTRVEQSGLLGVLFPLLLGIGLLAGGWTATTRVRAELLARGRRGPRGRA